MCPPRVRSGKLLDFIIVFYLETAYYKRQIRFYVWYSAEKKKIFVYSCDTAVAMVTEADDVTVVSGQLT